MARLTLSEEAERLGIKPPSLPTLRKYGLTAATWLGILKAQGWVCAVCLRRVTLFNTDHEHVPGWKHKPPHERSRYVRGVLCAYCNFRKVGRQTDPDEAQRIADYLRAYVARRDAR